MTIHIGSSLICLDCKTENLNFPRALEHTTLDEMFPSNLSVQSSENPAEEEAEGVGRQRVKRRPEAQSPLRQLSKSHIQTHREHVQGLDQTLCVCTTASSECFYGLPECVNK